MREDDTHSGFRVIELHSASQAALGKQAELGDDKLVELSERR